MCSPVNYTVIGQPLQYHQLANHCVRSLSQIIFYCFSCFLCIFIPSFRFYTLQYYSIYVVKESWHVEFQVRVYRFMSILRLYPWIYNRQKGFIIESWSFSCPPQVYVFRIVLYSTSIHYTLYTVYCFEHTLLEHSTDDTNAQLNVTKIFDHFPLFDETFCHEELCNCGISHMQRNPPKLF